MAKKFEWIVEDGSCVPYANTYVTVQEIRDHFSRLPGGEIWDQTDEGCKIRDEDAERYMAGAIEYLKLLDWVNDCCCCNDIPMPYDCSCACNGCSSNSYPAMRKAQMLIVDAMARGWQPFTIQGESIMVKSMSTPGGGSYNFDSAVDLNAFRGAAKSAMRSGGLTYDDLACASLMDKLYRVLSCFLKRSSRDDIALIL